MNIEEILKRELKANVEVKIDKMIEEEINKFTKQLLARKDEYIAEVMNGIRIHEEEQLGSIGQTHYVITFVNEVHLKD